MASPFLIKRPRIDYKEVALGSLATAYQPSVSPMMHQQLPRNILSRQGSSGVWKYGHLALSSHPSFRLQQLV